MILIGNQMAVKLPTPKIREQFHLCFVQILMLGLGQNAREIIP